jgi:hypothetical protein
MCTGVCSLGLWLPVRHVDRPRPFCGFRTSTGTPLPLSTRCWSEWYCVWKHWSDVTQKNITYLLFYSHEICRYTFLFCFECRLGTKTCLWASFLFCNLEQCGTCNYNSLLNGQTNIYRCPWRNVPDFGRIFLKLKYTNIIQNTYTQSWTVTEIMAREKCDLLAVPRAVPVSRNVLPVHCSCPSFSLQPAQAISRCDYTCKVLGTLRTTATLVRVFM